jgi:hypothetical protein
MATFAHCKPGIGVFRSNAAGASFKPTSRTIALSRRYPVQVKAEATENTGIEKTGPNFKALKEIQEIMEILPHR